MHQPLQAWGFAPFLASVVRPVTTNRKHWMGRATLDANPMQAIPLPTVRLTFEIAANSRLMGPDASRHGYFEAFGTHVGICTRYTNQKQKAKTAPPPQSSMVSGRRAGPRAARRLRRRADRRRERVSWKHPSRSALASTSACGYAPAAAVTDSTTASSSRSATASITSRSAALRGGKSAAEGKHDVSSVQDYL